MNEIAKNIICRIDRFILRYQKFIFLKYAIDFFFYLFILISLGLLIEHFLWLNVFVKTILWFLFWFLCLTGAIRFVLLPFLRVIGILERYSRENAVEVISSFFPVLQDYLINVYELIKEAEKEKEHLLIEAGIKQKSQLFSDIDFNKAVDLAPLKRSVFKITLLSFFIFLCFSIYNIESVNAFRRLVHYKTAFYPPPPFQFYLETKNLDVKKGGDLTIKVRILGEEIPELTYLKIHGQKFLMKSLNDSLYSYTLKNITRDLNFSFTDGKVESDLYPVHVLPVPEILSLSVKTIPPKYTRLSAFQQENDGNLSIPVGSHVSWNFLTLTVDTLTLYFENDTLFLNQSGETFQGGMKIRQNNDYSVCLKNQYFEENDKLRYQLNVIPDLYPELEVTLVRDSNQFCLVYYHGILRDDYGFSKLNMVISLDRDSLFSIPFYRNTKNQEFYYLMDFGRFKEHQNDITYYFEVWDNDAVYGPKRTCSPLYSFHFPSEEELKIQEKNAFEKMENLLSESKNIGQQLSDKLLQLKEKSIKGELTDWEKRQMVTDIVSQKQHLESIIDKVAGAFRENNDFQNSFSKEEQQILDKQQQIQELLDQVLSDELKNLLEQFSQLAREFDERKFKDLTRDIDLSIDDLSKQLDRNLEMLKRFQIEREIDNLADQLESLAENEEIESKELKSEEEGIRMNRENKFDFNQMINEYEKVLQKNDGLKHPYQLDSFEPEQKIINEWFHQTEQFFQKGRKNKASKGMMQNSRAKRQFASQMRSMLQSSQIKMQTANLETLQQLLYNLLCFSFSEEEIMADFRKVSADDPQFRELSLNQKMNREQWDFIRDSLYSTAEKMPILSQDFNTEIININSRLENVEEFISESFIGPARGSLQHIMTSANKLSLLLNEVIKAVKKAMNNAMPGDGGEQNNGTKNDAGLPDLKQSMEAFRNQLQKMIQQMKEGEGQARGEDLGKMLRRQEMLQKMLQKLLESGRAGGEAFIMISEIQNMLEQTRVELVNHNITVRTLERQHLIRTRLLEAESSMAEQDIDDRRESETAKEEFYNKPAVRFEKENNLFNFEHYFDKNDLPLNLFYQTKYHEYLKNLIEKPVNKSFAQ